MNSLKQHSAVGQKNQLWREKRLRKKLIRSWDGSTTKVVLTTKTKMTGQHAAVWNKQKIKKMINLKNFWGTITIRQNPRRERQLRTTKTWQRKKKVESVPLITSRWNSIWKNPLICHTTSAYSCQSTSSGSMFTAKPTKYSWCRKLKLWIQKSKDWKKQKRFTKNIDVLLACPLESCRNLASVAEAGARRSTFARTSFVTNHARSTNRSRLRC